MSLLPQTAVCQRCGRGFVYVASYRHLLERRRVKVNVPMSCTTCFRKKGPLPKSMGTIKWYNAHKRYGFKLTEEGREVFLHQQQIIGSEGIEPQSGQAVRFHEHHTVKGPEALNAELI